MTEATPTDEALADRDFKHLFSFPIAQPVDAAEAAAATVDCAPLHIVFYQTLGFQPNNTVMRKRLAVAS